MKFYTYRFEEKIGHGSFGEVFRATNLETQEEVAIKIPRLGKGWVNYDNLASEAGKWVKLSAGHPHLTRIREIRITTDDIAIVMEYIKERSLRELLAGNKGKIPSIEDAINIGTQVLSGLDHIHSHSMSHLDLKPENILMRLGKEPAITDFGLAWNLGSTASGIHGARGTLMYMSPEAKNEYDRSLHTDLWAAGMILYEMITGDTPPASRIVISAEWPEALKVFFQRALDIDPSKRFSSASEMLIQLRKLGPASSSKTDEEADCEIERIMDSHALLCRARCRRSINAKMSILEIYKLMGLELYFLDRIRRQSSAGHGTTPYLRDSWVLTSKFCTRFGPSDEKTLPKDLERVARIVVETIHETASGLDRDDAFIRGESERLARDYRRESLDPWLAQERLNRLQEIKETLMHKFPKEPISEILGLVVTIPDNQTLGVTLAEIRSINSLEIIERVLRSYARK